jgi:hypothetical protein
LLRGKENNGISGRGTAADLGRCAWQGEAVGRPAGNMAGGRPARESATHGRAGRHCRCFRPATY